MNHLNIQRVFEDRFGYPVRVINDVNAYALAEYQFGAGRGVHRLLCVALGTGLAISAILEGNLVETWGGVPADAGRIILDPASDARCAGGVKGSAEALLGTAAIHRLASQEYQRRVTARQVISASAAGADPIAGEVMAEIGARAGHLLALLSPIFFPQRILVTGGTAEAGPHFFQAINDRYQVLIGEYMQTLAALENDPPRPVEIVKGALGAEASILGAALEFI